MKSKPIKKEKYIPVIKQCADCGVDVEFTEYQLMSSAIMDDETMCNKCRDEWRIKTGWTPGSTRYRRKGQ